MYINSAQKTKTVFCLFVSYQPIYISISINIKQLLVSQQLLNPNFGSCERTGATGSPEAKVGVRTPMRTTAPLAFFALFFLLQKGHGPNGRLDVLGSLAPNARKKQVYWNCHVMDWKWGALLHSWIAYCVRTAGILFVGLTW